MEDLIKNIRIADYDYPLPEEKIATHPADPRDSSKLLIYRGGELSQDAYHQLGDHLPEGSNLIFNQTRVVQARLLFTKNESTTIEIFCLEPAHGQDIQQAMQATSELEYRCLVGGARKWKSGSLKLTTAAGNQLSAEKLARDEKGFIIRFSWSGGSHFAKILEEVGHTPLPPYMNRPAQTSDRHQYQTSYARTDGSVAAPTAGLHFTDELLQSLKKRGIGQEFLTLHVGAGTFKPVSSNTMAGHIMHSEEFFISRSLVERLRKSLAKKIIPVGTTSLRALESMYWLGVQFIEIPDSTSFVVNQWEPYRHYQPPTPKKAFAALAQKLIDLNLDMVTARTSLIIAPGYAHRICSGLITNFHQPRSTLLLLVASFIGEDWKKIYHYALKHDFRFLSYGDACLILKD